MYRLACGWHVCTDRCVGGVCVHVWGGVLYRQVCGCCVNVTDKRVGGMYRQAGGWCVCVGECVWQVCAALSSVCMSELGPLWPRTGEEDKV